MSNTKLLSINKNIYFNEQLRVKSSNRNIKKTFWGIWVLLCILFINTHSQASSFKMDKFLSYPDKTSFLVSNNSAQDSAKITINDTETLMQFDESGTCEVFIEDNKSSLYYVKMQDEYAGTLYLKNEEKDKTFFKTIPLWMSILPPLLSIFLALLTKQVIISLFAGILIGAWTFNGMTIIALGKGFLYTIDTLIVNALIDSGHASVIIFSMLIGGMVAIISKNGGMHGIVDKLSKYANSSKNTQLVTWFMGILIFFDDYANTLIVGNTMRPISDKYKISREKLAYIVDSTAAPVAAIALITTWIGAELGYISDALEQISLDQSPYIIFLNSLKYSMYPILTLAFMFILIKSGKDFGPMYHAEKNAREESDFNTHSKKNLVSKEQEEFEPDPSTPKYAFNGLMPILVLVATTIIGLFVTGYSSETWNNNDSFLNKLSITIGMADSYTALLWSSSIGVLTSIALSLMSKTLNATQSVEAMISGFKTMLPTMIILLLAWSLAETTTILHTSDFLINQFIGVVSVKWIPAITFILAGLISFSTGTSWGTMAILYPLLLPLTWSLGLESHMTEATLLPIFYNVVASVLGGAVLGDHCSPISDTTVLSSMASGCNHIEHVRTQMTYALCIGFISILLGSILMVFVNVPFIIVFLLGIAYCYLVVHIFGKNIEIPS